MRLLLGFLLLFLQLGLHAQDGAPAATPQQQEAKRLFGIVPNYRTAPDIKDAKPLSPREKFKIASQDSLDRGTFVLAGLFAGVGQLSNSSPSFGQGAAGYARYLGTSYGDYAIGNFMTEAVYPSLLHKDPRFFRKGTGSGWSRFIYAAGQVVQTHNDHGKVMFNYSELLGNSTAVAISNAYYPDNRTVGNAVGKLGTQIAVDAAANVLKEFFPDISRKFSRKKSGK